MSDALPDVLPDALPDAASDQLRRTRRRYDARLARIARWDRPLAGTADRIRAWWNMLLVDHGLFRLFYVNLHRVGAGRVWRSAQLNPVQIERLARRGIRTVLCLRGQPEFGSWQLERDACERLGVDLIDIQVRSRAAPEPETIRALQHAFETMRYPAVIHCKSGADRAGFAAALYLILRENAPVPVALRQLSLRYGHYRHSKTGILDQFYDAYLRHHAQNPTPFLDWVEHHYDPAALTRDFRPRLLHRLVSDTLLARE